MAVDLFPTLLAVLVYLFSLFGLVPKANESGRTPSPEGGLLSYPAATEVMAFYAERYRGDPGPGRSLRAAGSSLTTVMVFGPAVEATGALAGALDREMLAEARARGLKVLAAVHNAGSGRFDAAAVHALLRNPSARGRAIEEIYGLLVRYDLDGVCLDLENVPPGDREELTAFVRDLSARLRPHYFLVAACLPAKTGDDPGSAWGGAYDFASLGPHLDQAVIMAYDEHRLGGPPGPVASLGWVERVVRYAVSVLPRQKIVLGLPAYGYAWSAK
ncbi:MAG: hypothetical protein K6U03_10765, partial [Firmicutes bacterium]|nr:hypothetical protein [Bacillota bacterium]